MRALSAIFIAIFLGACTAGEPAYAMNDGEPLAELVVPAPTKDYGRAGPIVLLRDKATGDGFCTGFRIATKAVITAGHCTAERPGVEIEAVLDNGIVLRVYPGAQTDPDLEFEDWSVLRVLKPSLPAGWDVDQWDVLTLNCTDQRLKTRDRVTATGHAWGEPETFTAQGYINGRLRPFPPQWHFPLYPATLAVASGMSGSAVVLEETGYVIGILVGMGSPFAQASWAYIQPIKPVCNVLGITGPTS